MDTDVISKAKDASIIVTDHSIPSNGAVIDLKETIVSKDVTIKELIP